MLVYLSDEEVDLLVQFYRSCMMERLADLLAHDDGTRSRSLLVHRSAPSSGDKIPSGREVKVTRSLPAWRR